MDLSITTLIIRDLNIRLRDSINTVEGLIDRAIELGYKMIAITEHESLSSHVRAQRYYKKLKEKNPDLDLKLVLGNEIYLVRNGLNQSNYDTNQDRYFHFLLCALDETGHKQLREISTRAWERSYVARGYRRVPTYYQDLIDIVGKNPGHLVASTGCLGGIIGTQLLRWREREKPEDLRAQIEKWTIQMNNLFGQGYFFLEMQPSHNNEQIFVNKEIIKLSQKLNIPTIINLDAHYLSEKDRPIHKAFLTSQSGPREVDAFYMTTYLMDTKEIIDFMKPYITEEEIFKAFEGSKKVYEMVEWYDLQKPLNIPYLVKNLQEPAAAMVERWEEKIPLVREFSESKYPSDRHLVTQILERVEKDETLQNKETYFEINDNLRILEVSSKKMEVRWSAYLLNVRDAVDVMWDSGSIVGIGRGSGGAFLLNYILGIVQANPLREKVPMYSWRFLNPERASVLD